MSPVLVRERNQVAGSCDLCEVTLGQGHMSQPWPPQPLPGFPTRPLTYPPQPLQLQSCLPQSQETARLSPVLGAVGGARGGSGRNWWGLLMGWPSGTGFSSLGSAPAAAHP